MKKQIVLFSHGFGVDKTDRGFFSDIAAVLPGRECVMFDYNDMTADGMMVNPFSVQAERLRGQYNVLRASNPDAAIDLVCHSQGCIVAAMAGLKGFRRVVFLTPPATTAISNTVERARKDPNSHIDMEGISRLKRSDGSYTSVPAAYWREREGLDLLALYNAFAAHEELTLLQAENDHVLGNVDLSMVKTPTETLPGNHDFQAEARAGAVQRVKELLDE